MKNFTKKLFNFFSPFIILKIIIIFTLFFNLNCSDDNMSLFLEKESLNSEPVLVISGTVKEIIDGYTHQSLIRVDFETEPSVTYSDGSELNLPVSDGPSFVSGPITDPMANNVIKVGDIELSNTTGGTSYQSIADRGYYGVIIYTVDAAAAIAAGDILLDASLIGQEIEITIFDELP